VTFRALAALTLASGVVVLAAGLAILGETPWSPPGLRHLRRMKRRMEAPATYEPFTLDDFANLPVRLPLARRAAFETRAVSLEGCVQRDLLAADGDLHLEVAPWPRAAIARDTSYVTAEITPEWRRGGNGWSRERLAPVFRPNIGGATAWDSGPQRVRVSGWLMYDEQNDAPLSPWTREHGGGRVSGWEIHPVTRIERWDPATPGWAEVPR
jgi:hypothetical protein